MTAIQEEVCLELLITKEELERLKYIRVQILPKKGRQIGEGAFGKVHLYEFDNESTLSGKKFKIKLFSKSAAEVEQVKKVSND